MKTQLHAGLQSVQVNQIYLRVRCAEVGQEKSNVSLLLRRTSGGFEGAKTRGLTYLWCSSKTETLPVSNQPRDHPKWHQ